MKKKIDLIKIGKIKKAEQLFNNCIYCGDGDCWDGGDDCWDGGDGDCWDGGDGDCWDGGDDGGL